MTDRLGPPTYDAENSWVRFWKENHPAAPWPPLSVSVLAVIYPPTIDLLRLEFDRGR